MKWLNSSIQARSGFGMVEMIVMVGIMSVVGAAVISLIVDQNKHITRMQARQETVDLKNMMTMIMGSSEGCCPVGDQALGDIQFSNDGLRYPKSLSLRKVFNNCPTASSSHPSEFLDLTASDQGTQFRYLKIKDIKLDNISKIDPVGEPENFSASISIDFEMKNDSAPIRNVTVPIRFRSVLPENQNPNSKVRKIATCSNNNPNLNTGGLVGGVPSGVKILQTGGETSFTVPEDVRKLMVEVWAPGGEGGCSYDGRTLQNRGPQSASTKCTDRGIETSTFTGEIREVTLVNAGGAKGYQFVDDKSYDMHEGCQTGIPGEYALYIVEVEPGEQFDLANEGSTGRFSLNPVLFGIRKKDSLAGDGLWAKSGHALAQEKNQPNIFQSRRNPIHNNEESSKYTFKVQKKSITYSAYDLFCKERNPPPDIVACSHKGGCGSFGVGGGGTLPGSSGGPGQVVITW